MLEDIKERLTGLVNENCPDYIGLVNTYIEEIISSFSQSGFEDFTDSELLDDFITYAETVMPDGLQEECCSAEFQRMAPAKVTKMVTFTSNKKKALGKKTKYNRLGEKRTLREDSLDDFDCDGRVERSNKVAMQNTNLQDAIEDMKNDYSDAIKEVIVDVLQTEFGLAETCKSHAKLGEFQCSCENNIFGGSVNVGSTFFIYCRIGDYWDGIFPEHKKMGHAERLASISSFSEKLRKELNSVMEAKLADRYPALKLPLESYDFRVITSSSGIERCAMLFDIGIRMTKEALQDYGYEAPLSESQIRIRKRLVAKGYAERKALQNRKRFNESDIDLDEEKLDEGAKLKAFVIGAIMAVVGTSSLSAAALKNPADWDKSAAKCKQELTAEYGKGGTIPKEDFIEMCKALKTNDNEIVKKDLAKGGSAIGKRWFMSMDDCKDNVSFILDDMGFEIGD